MFLLVIKVPSVKSVFRDFVWLEEEQINFDLALPVIFEDFKLLKFKSCFV